MDFFDILDNTEGEAGETREYQIRGDPLAEYNDEQFRRRFRLNKASFVYVSDMIEKDLIRKTSRSHSLGGAHLLAIFLDFVGSNNFQLKSGDTSGVHQTTVSRAVAELSDWFSENVNKFIQWPNEEESIGTQTRIYEKYHLPGVVGMIDGSHMRIMSPSEDEPSYVNRYTRFETGEIKGRLIGDSAYKAEKYLIKIVPGDRLTEPEKRYNHAVCKARVKIEQAFGQLKRQFHILYGELRYAPVRASRIIIACICLQNVANAQAEPDDLNDIEDLYHQPGSDNEIDTTSGKSTIRSIVDHFFT